MGQCMFQTLLYIFKKKKSSVWNMRKVNVTSIISCRCRKNRDKIVVVKRLEYFFPKYGLYNLLLIFFFFFWKSKIAILICFLNTAQFYREKKN